MDYWCGNGTGELRDLDLSQQTSQTIAPKHSLDNLSLYSRDTGKERPLHNVQDLQRKLASARQQFDAAKQELHALKEQQAALALEQDARMREAENKVGRDHGV